MRVLKCLLLPAPEAALGLRPSALTPHFRRPGTIKLREVQGCLRYCCVHAVQAVQPVSWGNCPSPTPLSAPAHAVLRRLRRPAAPRSKGQADGREEKEMHFRVQELPDGSHMFCFEDGPAPETDTNGGAEGDSWHEPGEGSAAQHPPPDDGSSRPPPPTRPTSHFRKASPIPKGQRAAPSSWQGTGGGQESAGGDEEKAGDASTRHVAEAGATPRHVASRGGRPPSAFSKQSPVPRRRPPPSPADSTSPPPAAAAAQVDAEGGAPPAMQRPRSSFQKQSPIAQRQPPQQRRGPSKEVASARVPRGGEPALPADDSPAPSASGTSIVSQGAAGRPRSRFVKQLAITHPGRRGATPRASVAHAPATQSPQGTEFPGWLPGGGDGSAAASRAGADVDAFQPHPAYGSRANGGEPSMEGPGKVPEGVAAAVGSPPRPASNGSAAFPPPEGASQEPPPRQEDSLSRPRREVAPAVLAAAGPLAEEVLAERDGAVQAADERVRAREAGGGGGHGGGGSGSGASRSVTSAREADASYASESDAEGGGGEEPSGGRPQPPQLSEGELEKLSLQQLREVAQGLGKRGVSRLRKAELVRSILHGRELGQHTVKELQAMAKERGIKGFSRLTKAELLGLLSGGSGAE